MSKIQAEQIPSVNLVSTRIFFTRIFVLLLLPLILCTAPVGFQDNIWLIKSMEFIGYLLLIICAFGRSFSSVFIGGYKNKKIVSPGIYSIVRNPLYVFSFIGVVGIGLVSLRLTVLFILTTAFILYYKTVVNREEKYLEHKFGKTYQDYYTSTPRWFPDFSKWKCHEEITTKPHLVLRNMLEASLFLLTTELFDFIGFLQDIGFVPILALIP
jgi:protein-S-isoprenylcysteine O-methyltransferase Ste14